MRLLSEPFFHEIVILEQNKGVTDSDVELAASGLLSSKMGGPPVYPPIPNGVMGQGQVKREWKVSTGEDRFRRGLYTFIYEDAFKNISIKKFTKK